MVGGVFWKDSSGKGFITPDKNTCFALVEFYARNFDLFIADDYLTSSGLATVVGSDGDGGLALRNARDLAVGIDGGDLRLVGFPRHILVRGILRGYRCRKRLARPNQNGDRALVKRHTGDADSRRGGFRSLLLAFTARPETGRQQYGRKQQRRLSEYIVFHLNCHLKLIFGYIFQLNHFEACFAESFSQPFQLQGGFAGPASGSLVTAFALECSISQESLARPTYLFQQLFDHRF